MKNMKPRSDRSTTLSLEVLKLRYKAARTNHRRRINIDNIRRTNDVNAWLRDKKQRGWLNVHCNTVVLRD